MTSLVVAVMLSAAPVALEVRPACEGRFASAELYRLLAIELQGAVVEPGAPIPSGAEAVRLECGIGRTFHLSTAPELGAGSSRSLDLVAEAARDVPRLLALAIAELTHRVPRGPAPRTSVRYAALPRPPSLAPTPPPIAIETDRVHPEVLIGARVQRGNWLYGGGLGLVAGIRELGFVGFEATFERANRATALGTVDADLWTAALFGGVRGRWGAWTLDGGVGGRLGLAFLTGRPNSGGVVGATLPGLWAGPAAMVRAGWSVARGFSLIARLEVGHGVSGVSGQVEGQRAVALEGTFGSLALGVRL